jgi:hypothetical protein
MPEYEGFTRWEALAAESTGPIPSSEGVLSTCTKRHTHEETICKFFFPPQMDTISAFRSKIEIYHPKKNKNPQKKLPNRAICRE